MQQVKDFNQSIIALEDKLKVQQEAHSKVLQDFEIQVNTLKKEVLILSSDREVYLADSIKISEKLKLKELEVCEVTDLNSALKHEITTLLFKR